MVLIGAMGNFPHETRPPNRFSSDMETELMPEQVKQMIESIPAFHGRTDSLEVCIRDGTVVLKGVLPNDYLREQLRLGLVQIDPTIDLRDEIDIVCSQGVSSEPRKSNPA